MQKLLLSSVVMFFLCTASFAQQKQQVTVQKNKKIMLNQNDQADLEKKKISENEATETSLTSEQKSAMDAQKMQMQKLEKERKLAERNAMKAEVVPNATKGQ